MIQKEDAKQFINSEITEIKPALRIVFWDVYWGCSTTKSLPVFNAEKHSKQHSTSD